MMYTAYAIGGPRDKVKLTCDGSWDGRIRKPTQVEQPVKVPWYAGRYVWHATYGWVWQEELEVPQSVRYSGGYHTAGRGANTKGF